ncbi:uncharacterized protein DEA37_0014957, partial [Paragonimus westermani]
IVESVQRPKEQVAIRQTQLDLINGQEQNFTHTFDYVHRITDEQRLLDTILHGYDSDSRPTYEASNSVTVGFQMTLIQISKLEETVLNSKLISLSKGVQSTFACIAQLQTFEMIASC